MNDNKKIIPTNTNLEYRVDAANLLSGLYAFASKDDAEGDFNMFTIPMSIFCETLAKVGQRAGELNDPQMNALMCRLTIYSVSDPTSEDYNAELTQQIINYAKNLGDKNATPE